MTRIANTEQYEAWNGDSGQRWVADPDRRDRLIAPVADALFSAARLDAGESVLDLGCGCGATTLAAARIVAPGNALGIDLSAPMLEVARRRRDAAGLTNVAFEQADAQVHALTYDAFDVAISRFGTMFYADAAAAFSNVARALRRGGRLAFASWQPLAANDWLAIPAAAMIRYGSNPAATDGPGMFAQSDPAIITTTLRKAGFDAIDVAPVAITLTLGSDPDDAADHVADSGVGRAVLETVPEQDRPAARDAVREVFADHMTGDGVQLGASIWITTARRAD
jgi:SAM-dependent methyltransferase